MKTYSKYKKENTHTLSLAIKLCVLFLHMNFTVVFSPKSSANKNIQYRAQQQRPRMFSNLSTFEYKFSCYVYPISCTHYHIIDTLSLSKQHPAKYETTHYYIPFAAPRISLFSLVLLGSSTCQFINCRLRFYQCVFETFIIDS